MPEQPLISVRGEAVVKVEPEIARLEVSVVSRDADRAAALHLLEERVETVLSTPREALMIGTNPALPMLLLHRVSWGPDGKPFERVRSLFRGDRLSFMTRLGRDD